MINHRPVKPKWNEIHKITQVRPHGLRPDGPVHKMMFRSNAGIASGQPDVADRTGGQEVVISKDVALDIRHESS